jgi:electron transfer flavoprotein alpha subunit
MRYHFVVNGYSGEIIRQMQEQRGILEQAKTAGAKLDLEAGEAIIYCRSPQDVERFGKHHADGAIYLTAENYVPEVFLEKLPGLMAEGDLYLFGSDFSGAELAVRAAERCGGSSVTAVSSLLEVADRDGSKKVRVKKMVYSNHMEATFEIKKGPFMLSLAKGADRAELLDGGFAMVDRITCAQGAEHILSTDFLPRDEEKGLEDAKVILAAGRGIRRKENLEYLERAAGLTGGEVGVSRPAAMNAWAPMERLIGVSGAMVAPEICITAGVSGAAAFYSGIEKSRFIVAVNTDEKAPIMKKADVAIVDDFVPVLEALGKKLEEDG